MSILNIGLGKLPLTVDIVSLLQWLHDGSLDNETLMRNVHTAVDEYDEELPNPI